MLTPNRSQRGDMGVGREPRLTAGAIQSAESAKTLVQWLLAWRHSLQPVAMNFAKLVAAWAISFQHELKMALPVSGSPASASYAPGLERASWLLWN